MIENHHPDESDRRPAGLAKVSANMPCFFEVGFVNPLQKDFNNNCFLTQEAGVPWRHVLLKNLHRSFLAKDDGANAIFLIGSGRIGTA